METVTLAGGCFWCTEAIFKRLKGVKSVVSGYAGGEIENPSYEEVSTGKTGHAEAIQIKFDPKVISFGKLLEIFWHLVDPTTLNKQGADVGTQYRSVIFYHSPDQKKIVEESKEKTDQSGIYKQSLPAKAGKNPIVTKIEAFKNFFKAEDYHQNYFERNSYQPYCQLIINPKIEKLIQEFNEYVK